MIGKHSGRELVDIGVGDAILDPIRETVLDIDGVQVWPGPRNMRTITPPGQNSDKAVRANGCMVECRAARFCGAGRWGPQYTPIFSFRFRAPQIQRIWHAGLHACSRFVNRVVVVDPQVEPFLSVSGAHAIGETVRHTLIHKYPLLTEAQIHIGIAEILLYFRSR